MNIKKVSRKWWLSIGATIMLVALVWMVGTAVAQGPDGDSPVAPTGGPSLTDTFTYQGLLENDGQPANSNYDFTVEIWDGDDPWGSYVAPCDNHASLDDLNNFPVEDGVFTFHLICDWNSDVFTGAPRWIQVYVREAGSGEPYTTLPRQSITAVPYAFSLRPGATIKGGVSSPSAVISVTQTYGNPWDSAFGVYGYAPETGVYGRGDTTGVGGFGHWRGVYGQGGLYGVYGSGNDTGVRGYSGSGHGGNFQGKVGLEARGTGTPAQGGYAASFVSENYRGIYAQSSTDASYYAGYFKGRNSSSAGIYIDGTLTASGSKSGYVVDVCLNDGSEPLEVGDVVAVVGSDDPVIGEIPVMRVRKATAETASAVVGVVDQRFLVHNSEGESLFHPDANVPRLAAGTAIAQDEYVSVVTLGAFKAIKVDASYGAIQPGDLLTASPNPGYAMRAADPKPGTIVGKALEALDAGTGTIKVLVTLH